MDTLPSEMVEEIIKRLDKISIVLARIVCRSWSIMFPAHCLCSMELALELVKYQNIPLMEKLLPIISEYDLYDMAIFTKAKDVREWLWDRVTMVQTSYDYAHYCIKRNDIDGLEFHLGGPDLETEDKYELLRSAFEENDIDLVNMVLCFITHHGRPYTIEEIDDISCKGTSINRIDRFLTIIYGWDKIPNARKCIEKYWIHNFTAFGLVEIDRVTSPEARKYLKL